MTNHQHPHLQSTAIRVEGLTKRFGDLEALAGVDFEVPTGTVLGVLGPNGAGKTTTVRILTTVLAADGGYAEVLGIDVGRRPDAVRARIGLAGQYAAVDGNLTGRENLRLIGRLTHLGRPTAVARADELLERFGLTDAADRMARTYSGGMRRRLDLAAALVHRPPVLFLDEPTTGLDPHGRANLWEVIEDLAADGTTVLLTTQYLEEADRLADDIILINNGGVIAHGHPDRAQGPAREHRARGRPRRRPRRGAGVRSRGAVRGPLPRPHRPRRAARGRRRRAHRRAGAARPRPARPRDARPHGPRAEPRRRVPLAHRRPPRLRRRHRRLRPYPERALRDPRCRMTTIALQPDATDALVAPPAAVRLRSAIGDTLAVQWRNLLGYVRTPQLLVFSTIQPVIFVLLFRYVFGGAIHVPGTDYVDFLMPGIFAQTVVFGAMATAIGLSTDLQGGLIERFRSLPIARSAFLTGRTTADLARNVLVLALMCVVGFAVGWRVHTDVISFLGAMLLMLAFGYAMSWIFATVGLIAKDPESAQAASFPILAPLIFASSAFVPVSSMPSWLQGFAEHQPVSAVTTAVRGLTLGGATTSDVLIAIAWCVGIVAVAAPLAVRRYRRTV